MLRVYLRSLDHEPALICAEASQGTTTTLQITGPVKARQTLRTLLRLTFPHLKADLAALKTVCTQNPLFQYWFQVEAIREEVISWESPSVTAQSIWTRFRHSTTGCSAVWQGLFHPDPHHHVHELQPIAGHLCAQDWFLAKQMLIDGLIPVKDLKEAILQTPSDRSLSLADRLLRQGWIQPETVASMLGNRASSPMVAIGDRSPEKLRLVQRSR